MMPTSEIKETLAPILRVLGELGGKFMFMDDEGREFVICRRQEFDTLTTQKSEQQLALPPLKKSAAGEHALTAGYVLDRINREIAVYQMQQEDEQVDDLAVPKEGEDTSEQAQDKQGKRVRFEALKGDLPPELQE